MINLCYSTFLHLIKDYYIYDIATEILAFDVISQITPEAKRSKYTKGHLGFFWDRDRNIPSDLRENIAKEPYKTNCKNLFKNIVSVQLNIALKDDFYMKLETSSAMMIQSRQKRKHLFTTH